MPKIVADYTDACNNCLCSIPRSWIGGLALETMSQPFYCNHPSNGEARKVAHKDAFNTRPEWCALDKGDQVLIQIRPKDGPCSKCGNDERAAVNPIDEDHVAEALEVPLNTKVCDECYFGILD